MMNWTEKDNKLVGEFVFEDFSQVWAFMTEVAILDQCLESGSDHPHYA